MLVVSVQVDRSNETFNEGYLNHQTGKRLETNESLWTEEEVMGDQVSDLSDVEDEWE